MLHGFIQLLEEGSIVIELSNPFLFSPRVYDDGDDDTTHLKLLTSSNKNDESAGSSYH